jgi:hypothetical protein
LRLNIIFICSKTSSFNNKMAKKFSSTFLEFFEGVEFTRPHHKGRGFFKMTEQERGRQEMQRLTRSAYRAERRSKRISKQLENAEKRRENRGSLLQAVLDTDKKETTSMIGLVEKK